MRKPKATLLALTVAAARGAGQSPAADATPTQASGAHHSSENAADGRPSGGPHKAGASCADRVDYAGDSRSNAEINRIGSKSGYCPPVQH